MYDELIKRLREANEKSMCGECGLNLHTGATKKGVLFAEAADVIEELSMKLHGDEAAIAGMKREIDARAQTACKRREVLWMNFKPEGEQIDIWE